MATKVDPAIAKQRQQKMILIFGGVILAGLLAFQGPKLMHHGAKASTAASSTTTPATSSDTADSNPTATTTPATTSTGPAALPITSNGKQSANVAGVVVRPAGPPAAATGQLFSFTSFKAKDPFVPGVKDGSGSGTSTDGATPSGTAAAGSATGPIATPTTSTPVAFAYATLMVNGKPQQLQLKQTFPKGQPTFVLVGVDKNSIKIAVAGGKFTGGAAVKLDRGKPVTMMNTTTGQRFVMKLVFTGDQPEQIAGFKQPVTSSGTTTASNPTTTASNPTTASTP